MKSIAVFLLLVAPVVNAGQVEVNPLQKVLQLLADLQAKVIAEGEAEEKAYRDYFEWCDDASKELQFEIKTGKSQVEELKATIAKEASDIEAAEAKIAELAEKIATAAADLKNATEIRDKEHADFAANEADLMDAIDVLGRAIKILEKHVSMLQEQGGQAKFAALAQSFSALIDASALSLHDKTKLQSLLQSKSSDADEPSGEEEEAEAEALGAPKPAVYKGHSKGIVEVLEDMLDKAESELAEARKEEMNAQHNYEMLKQSLEDAMQFGGEEKAATEKEKAECEEAKATAEGDLEETSKSLADAEKNLKDMSMQCMTQAQAHDVSKASREEELRAIAEAKKIIESMTAGAEARTYSFLQIGATSEIHSRIRTHMDLVGFEAVHVIKKLAQKQRSTLLAQLASQMEAAIRTGGQSGDDVFAKVKGLIKEMIERLLKEAADEAAHKAWCDHEMGETKAKKEKLTGVVEDLTTKIAKANADIKKLAEEIATLQDELAKLAKLQAEMDKNRIEEHEEFLAVKADLEQGLEGIRAALKVLREYYAKGAEESLIQNGFDSLMQEKQPEPPAGHTKAEGSASGIIGILEVIEADFGRGLAEAKTNEEMAQELYDKTTQENKVTKATKEQDVAYKTKERKSLEKFVAEATADLEGTQTELDAVLEYWKKLQDQCIAKPETYEERKKRREAEIAGLKEALSILEGEASFLQRGTRHSLLRGVRQHA